MTFRKAWKSGFDTRAESIYFADEDNLLGDYLWGLRRLRTGTIIDQVLPDAPSKAQFAFARVLAALFGMPAPSPRSAPFAGATQSFR
jgi:hypothetical protein